MIYRLKISTLYFSSSWAAIFFFFKGGGLKVSQLFVPFYGNHFWSIIHKKREKPLTTPSAPPLLLNGGDGPTDALSDVNDVTFLFPHTYTLWPGVCNLHTHTTPNGLLSLSLLVVSMHSNYFPIENVWLTWKNGTCQFPFWNDVSNIQRKMWTEKCHSNSLGRRVWMPILKGKVIKRLGTLRRNRCCCCCCCFLRLCVCVPIIDAKYFALWLLCVCLSKKH